jgi:hypothetical protein
MEDRADGASTPPQRDRRHAALIGHFFETESRRVVCHLYYFEQQIGHRLGLSRAAGLLGEQPGGPRKAGPGTLRQPSSQD